MDTPTASAASCCSPLPYPRALDRRQRGDVRLAPGHQQVTDVLAGAGPDRHGAVLQVVGVCHDSQSARPVARQWFQLVHASQLIHASEPTSGSGREVGGSGPQRGPLLDAVPGTQGADLVRIRRSGPVEDPGQLEVPLVPGRRELDAWL